MDSGLSLQPSNNLDLLVNQPYLSKLHSLNPSFVSSLNPNDCAFVQALEPKGDAVGELKLAGNTFFYKGVTDMKVPRFGNN